MVKNISNEFMDIQVRKFTCVVFGYKFRGAALNQKEKTRLIKLGGKILREAGLDFEEGKDYDDSWEEFADFYLMRCWDRTKMINVADASVYHKLVEIDTLLGMNASTQLACCLCWTTRGDIIKV